MSRFLKENIKVLQRNSPFFKKGLTRAKLCAIIFKQSGNRLLDAGVAEQADARDLKSRDT